mmetsp:Transcript_14096/g.21083  ORF Transcript_14096/g.21083 Transcript_14096/m.21083 type:complete len:299 (-) Transcript_14096:746-1642(-)
MPRMQHAASVAAAIEFNLFAAGSHTPTSSVLQIPSLSTSTPIHIPAPSVAVACSLRRRLRTSVLSIPALSASCRGITSRARANEVTTNCCLPTMVLACSRRTFESSSSIAPPPATIDRLARVRLTIMIASCTERSVSSRNCSPPPRNTIVAVFALGHPLKKLYLSSPRPFSSNKVHSPSTSAVRPLTEVCTAAPVALDTLSRSSVATLPAQNMPRSAKYWVARSPIGRRDRTTLAPHLTQLSSFSYIIFHSASTMDWYWSGSVIRTSAFSFSLFSSSSTFSKRILGLLKCFGCCSNPA